MPSTEQLTATIVAAAHILTGERGDDPIRNKRSWQDEAWAFYDESGPLRYGVTWIANMISKARLQAARVEPGGDEPEPITDGPAAEAVEALAGGIGEQSQLLRSLAIHLTVPGLGYLVGTDSGLDWNVYSADVLRMREPATPLQPAIYEVQRSDSKWEDLPAETLIVKIWRPHARYPWEADSPARAALGSLKELRRIGQYIDAVLVSRLAGAGLFIFPKEATFPTAPGESDGQHPFVTEVMNVMMTAVRRPGTAAQVVPIPIEVPGEYADKFKLVSWATELSDKILAMRESALRQTSIALDIPAEILTGMGDLNHWASWQIEESAIKVHAEPLLEVITAALTEGYLLPTLEAAGEDTEGLIIWADTSELAARPDRSDDALQLYDRGELNGEALRRETGMNEADALEGDDLADWVYKRNVANAQLATMAWEGLGVDVPQQEQPQASPAVTGNGALDEPIDEDESGAERRTTPGTQDDEAPEPGDQALDVARLLVLEGHVRRALTVARNRINGGDRKRQPFDGVWNDALETLGDVGLDPVCAVDRLESYCQTLINTGATYDRTSLALAMQAACVREAVVA